MFVGRYVFGALSAFTGKNAKKAAFFSLALLYICVYSLAFISPGRASAETPTGPTKRLIVRYSNVLGSSTEDPAAELSGYVQREDVYQNIPYAVYEADAEGEQSLLDSGVALQVFEDKVLEWHGDVPIPTIGGDPVNGVFTDTVANVDYDGLNTAVAIIDTGVDKNHLALSGGVIHEACFATNTGGFTSGCPGGATFSNAVNSALDCDMSITGCGHGTKGAGAATMVPVTVDVDGDTVGDPLSGVAAGAEVVALRLGTTSTNPLYCGVDPECVVPLTSDILAALDYLIDLDVGVPIAAANMSFGGGSYGTLAECQAEPEYSFYYSAFSQLRSRGIAPVVSTGNSGATPGNENKIGSPACVQGAVAVGATNILGDSVASYSENGPLTTLLAPGGDFDGVNLDTFMWLPLNGTPSSFSTAQGTSFSAPMTSGAFAVLREKHPDATVTQLTDLLVSTGTPVTDVRSGYTVGAKPLIQLGDAVSTSTFPVISSFNGPGGTVNEGGDTDFTVTTSDVASCSLDNGIGAVDVSSGSFTVPGFASYTLTCTGDYNDTTTATFNASAFNLRPTQPNTGNTLTVSTDSAARTANISWAASTDTDGIDHYAVYLDGTFVQNTNSTNFTFSDLGLDLEYTATVYAVDSLGAQSLGTSTTFVLGASTTPGTPNTGFAQIFKGTQGMFIMLLALSATGAVIAYGRKYLKD